jgi:photosystem II stability/assembly factor-like uncharacterized protein
MRLRTTGTLIAVILYLLIAVSPSLVKAQIQTKYAMQSEYQWMHPLPQGNYLGACAQIDPLKVVAVGHVGTIISTADGGTTWSMQYIGDGVHLWDVCFSDDMNGTAVGGYAKIFRTIDGGATWTPQTSGTTGTFWAVSFASAMTGNIVGSGGTILRTVDGGANWTPQVSGTTADLLDVSFTDAENGTAVGDNGTILRTVDGGTNWIPQGTGIDAYLTAVDFSDSLMGVTIGSRTPGDFSLGIMLRTTDGGTTWIQNWARYNVVHSDVDLVDSSTGYIIGSGELLKTTDGGDSWTDLLDGSPLGVVISISFTNGLVGTAVGYGGEIMQTTDGGNSWISRRRADDSVYNISSVCFINSSTGVAIAGQKILRTIDGGWTWTIQEEASGFVSLLDVAFADELNGSAVGINGGIATTTDGGISWEWKDSGTPARLNGVSFGTATTGAAGGWMSTFVRTFDAGVSWELVASPSSDSVEDVFMFDATHGVAAQSTGRVYVTNNAWASWSTRVVGEQLSAIHFADRSTGWTVGYERIYKSFDGGLTWHIQLELVGEAPIGVSFLDALTGTVVGRSGLLLRTTDGGSNWTRHIVTGNRLTGVDVNGMAVGSYGTILGLDVEVATQITGFSAEPDGESVELTWDISSDDVVLGFQLLRSDTANPLAHLTNGLIDHSARSFHDRSTEPGREYEYVLVVVLHSLVEVRSVPVRVSTTSLDIDLDQNFPNPFNPTTSISFYVPTRTGVQLEVYDVAGHLIKKLATGVHEAGRHDVEWDGTNGNDERVGSGVYIYRLTAGKQVASKKMTLLK